MSVPMHKTLINGKWELMLPEHRAERPEWVTGWERERLDSMRANLEPGMLVYDIGAEEGDLPALWALWGCSVVMVEPNPRVWSNIRVIWEGNGFAPHGWFVGFASDKDEVPQAAKSWQTAINGWPRCAWHDVIRDHGFCNVPERPDIPQTTIDTLADRFGPPDAITMDIEGAEFLALSGAERTITEHRPLIWVSMHPHFMADMYGIGMDHVWEWFRSHGYQWRCIHYDHELHVLAWHCDRKQPELPKP